MTASATGADARRERGKMPVAASDQVSNKADAPVPPLRFVVYTAVCTVQGDEEIARWPLARFSLLDELKMNPGVRLQLGGSGTSPVQRVSGDGEPDSQEPDQGA